MTPEDDAVRTGPRSADASIPAPDAAPDRPIDRAMVSIAGHRGNVAVISQALRHHDPALRVAGLSAAVRADMLGPGQLTEAMHDPDPLVRRRVTDVAARLPHSTELESHLVNRLSDDDTIAEVAAFALGEIGSMPGIDLAGSTIAAIEHQALHHNDALCRESAVAALGALHTGRATILAATNDKATVRRRAIIALAPFDGPDITAALERALDDRDWQVRQAAEDLLPAPDQEATTEDDSASDRAAPADD